MTANALESARDGDRGAIGQASGVSGAPSSAAGEYVPATARCRVPTQRTQSDPGTLRFLTDGQKRGGEGCLSRSTA